MKAAPAMDTLPKKYELLTSDTRTLGDGTVVYRIRALRDLGSLCFQCQK
jgi:hypothetical protein